MDTLRNMCLWFFLWSWYQSIEACNSCSACLQPPAFISNFTTMRAQSSTESTLTINHGLGQVPVRVEVQVRPPPGRPDTEYVFPGLESAQTDDDLPRTYGGVAYKYNSQHVVLAVPKMGNQNPTGTIIYTGDNIWIGPKSQREQTAEVRVKLWTNCTFPAPDFESSWIPVSSVNVGDSYREVEHGLGVDPEYVSVQVKNLNTDWYSDGSGSSSKRPTLDSNWGATLYGANDTHVRIWVPHAYNGNIFSVDDGWGIDEDWSAGLVKIRVWRTFRGSLVYKSTTSVHSGLRPAGHEVSTPYLDIESGMIDVKMRAIGGHNTGFYFPATGAVQNAQPNESYGGVVYSYSENGVRFWHPHLSRVGTIQQNYLVYINSDWGGGLNSQASTSGDLVIRFWNSSVDSPTTTTTKAASTTDMGSTRASSTLKAVNSGVSKLALGLIITASLITAAGCGATGYFGVRKMKNMKRNNKTYTESGS